MAQVEKKYDEKTGKYIYLWGGSWRDTPPPEGADDTKKSTGQIKKELGFSESKPGPSPSHGTDCDKLVQGKDESALMFASRKAKCRQSKNTTQSEALK